MIWEKHGDVKITSSGMMGDSVKLRVSSLILAVSSAVTRLVVGWEGVGNPSKCKCLSLGVSKNGDVMSALSRGLLWRDQ